MESGCIYCIDDDEDILLLYKIVLGQAGHEVVTFLSGKEALKIVEKQNPNLIILDEKMRNDISGMEICKRIRKNKKIPYIPIIMVTALEDKQGKIRSLEEGIDDYILKPFDHEELLAKVMVMLRIKRLYMDLLKTRQDLVHAEKLAAVGQLAAAMAHEIRNPLSIINASVQFLKGKLHLEKEGREVMETVLRKITQIDGTIRELLVAARPMKFKQQAMDINKNAREVVGFIKEKCQAQEVELQLELEDSISEVMGEEEHLQRVFLNLFINALNSMSAGGILKVATQEEEDSIKITVEDNGLGIYEDDIEHLFEPFFSKQAGGSGLGLFVVKMIVDEFKGTIQVNSTVGQGTKFTITLPAIQKKKLKPI
ncbi:response regulator [bacterium]|nr:response regulator [bacterium]